MFSISSFIGVFVVLGLYVLYEVWRWKRHEMKDVECFTPKSYSNHKYGKIETNSLHVRCANDHPEVYYMIDEDVGWVKCKYCFIKYVYK